MVNNDVGIRAKKISDSEFEVVFVMNKQAIKERLELIRKEIKWLLISKQRTEERLKSLTQEKLQIELSLGQK